MALESLSEASQILVFTVDGRRYGLLSTCVLEVLRAAAVVPLPKAPHVILGVLNVRGETLPVFNMRARFQAPAKPLDPTDHFIIALAGTRKVVLHVDQTHDLIRLTSQAVDPQSIVPGAEYVRWIVNLADGMLLIHDLASFLSQSEADQLEAALQPQ